MTITEVGNEHLKMVNTSWDHYIDEWHSEKDISLEKVQQFIDRVNRNRGFPVLDDPLSVLQKFELLRNGKVTRAAFFLFMAYESDLNTIELGRFQTPTLIKDGARLQTGLFAEVDGWISRSNDFLRAITSHFLETGKSPACSRKSA